MKTAKFYGSLERQIDKVMAREEKSFEVVVTEAIALYDFITKMQGEGRVIKAYRVDEVIVVDPVLKWNRSS